MLPQKACQKVHMKGGNATSVTWMSDYPISRIMPACLVCY